MPPLRMPLSPQEQMIAAICDEARSAAPWVGRDYISQSVLDAMSRVPRHEFVPPGLSHAAYHNSALPIGEGQTISQPYIVALMTDLLALSPTDRVLEVGTGSGYQAAVLSLLVTQLYSLEIIEELGMHAQALLRRLGYSNVDVVIGNGFQGLPEFAPYDAIIVTAAPDMIPQSLIQQLAPGGRMIIPVGCQYQGQDLTVVEKHDDGSIHSKVVLPVAFVPMTGS